MNFENSINFLNALDQYNASVGPPLEPRPMGSINGPMSAKSPKSTILTKGPFWWVKTTLFGELEEGEGGLSRGTQAAYVQKSRALAICGEGPIVTLVVWDAFIALALSVVGAVLKDIVNIGCCLVGERSLSLLVVVRGDVSIHLHNHLDTI